MTFVLSPKKCSISLIIKPLHLRLLYDQFRIWNEPQLAHTKSFFLYLKTLHLLTEHHTNPPITESSATWILKQTLSHRISIHFLKTNTIVSQSILFHPTRHVTMSPCVTSANPTNVANLWRVISRVKACFRGNRASFVPAVLVRRLWSSHLKKK